MPYFSYYNIICLSLQEKTQYFVEQKTGRQFTVPLNLIELKEAEKFRYKY